MADRMQVVSAELLSSRVLGLAVFVAACLLFSHGFNRVRHVVQRLRAHVDKEASKAAKLEEAPPTVTRALDFPDDWWTSERLFQLEKIAIFSKASCLRRYAAGQRADRPQTWLHACHSSLIPRPGDFRTFQIADFSFFIIRGKDGKLRAFHNVCRHRAYNVTNKSSGHANVLMCKYHGWTYDSRGQLIKAPKFEDIAGFDKSQNGLFEIRTFIDSSGLLYVNFDVYGSDGLTIRVGVPIRARLTMVESWTIEANSNWKIAVTTGAFRVRSLVSLSKMSTLLSQAITLFESWTWPAEIELSSLTRVLRSAPGDLWLTISVVPVSQSKTSISCAFYTSQVEASKIFAVAAAKQEVVESVKLLEDKYVLVKEERLIPDSSYQEPLLAELQAHTRLERLMRREVFPASRLRESSQACRVADDLCRELEAAEGASGVSVNSDALAW